MSPLKVEVLGTFIESSGRATGTIGPNGWLLRREAPIADIDSPKGAKDCALAAKGLGISVGLTPCWESTVCERKRFDLRVAIVKNETRY